MFSAGMTLRIWAQWHEQHWEMGAEILPKLGNPSSAAPEGEKAPGWVLGAWLCSFCPFGTPRQPQDVGACCWGILPWSLAVGCPRESVVP